MNVLQRKIGPLPAYAWAGLVVVGILLAVKLRNRNAGAATTQAAALAVDDGSGATDASLNVPHGGSGEYSNTGGGYNPGNGNPLGGDKTFDFQAFNDNVSALTTASRNNVDALNAETTATLADIESRKDLGSGKPVRDPIPQRKVPRPKPGPRGTTPVAVPPYHPPRPIVRPKPAPRHHPSPKPAPRHHPAPRKRR